MDKDPNKNRPDWGSFEVYKGPEEPQPGRFRSFLLTLNVIVLCSILVFVIGGTFGTFLVARTVSRKSSRPQVQLNFENTFYATGGLSVLLVGAWVGYTRLRGGGLSN